MVIGLPIISINGQKSGFHYKYIWLQIILFYNMNKTI
jgi:hypothetical protein